MATACSRMSGMVLADFGRNMRCSRMRTLILGTSGKAIDLL